VVCDETLTLRHGYLDGELGLEGTLQLERHLAECPRCARDLEELRALRTELRSALQLEVPAGLEERLRSSLRFVAHGDEPGDARPAAPQADRPLRAARARRGGPRGGWTTFGLPWRAAGLAAAMVLAVIAGLRWLPLPARAPADGAFSGASKLAEVDALEREVLDSHLRSLLADHLVDVPSTDRHTVKPWFDGKLDFAPAVLDLERQGFPLAGGRLDYVQERPVAALVYRRRQHVINLLTWPQSGEAPPKASVDHGYNLLHWTEGGMTYWAVSDLNAHELAELCALLRGPSPEAATR
jgi:anti-sigma factor RsiW